MRLKARRRKHDTTHAEREISRSVEHADHYAWWTSRTKVYGPPEVVRDKIAFLNLGAYHSPSFEAYHALAALPSSRVVLDWAHEVLFPQAVKGDKVVVCMRAAEQWGLKAGRVYGQSLYAPATVRGGHMKKAGDHAEIRCRIVNAVRAAISTSA